MKLKAPSETKREFYARRMNELIESIPDNKLHEAKKGLEKFAEIEPLQDRVERHLNNLIKGESK